MRRGGRRDDSLGCGGCLSVAGILVQRAGSNGTCHAFSKLYLDDGSLKDHMRGWLPTLSGEPKRPTCVG